MPSLSAFTTHHFLHSFALPHYAHSFPTRRSSDLVTAILGVHDFFGELCLAGYPLRMSTAVALTASSIRTIKKEKMLEMLRKKNKTSNSLVAYLLSSVKKYREIGRASCREKG